MVVGTLWSVDIAFTMLWVFVDPLKRKVKKFSLIEPLSGPTEDIRLLPVLEYCESDEQNVWTGMLLYYLYNCTKRILKNQKNFEAYFTFNRNLFLTVL